MYILKLKNKENCLFYFKQNLDGVIEKSIDIIVDFVTNRLPLPF